MLWRYLKVQAYVLFVGMIGPLFLVLYFASDRDPFMQWFLWSGLVMTVAGVVIAVAITARGERSAAKMTALEQTGVLALARVVGIQETGTRINDQPLVKLDLQISGPGIQPFASQDRVIASIARLPMITSRKLVALVDPATNEYKIDWERSAFVSGAMPATFTIDEDNQTYDLSGQAEPLIEILQILKTNGFGWKTNPDLSSNPTARQQVRAVIRRAAAQQAPAAPAAAAAAAPITAPPEPSAAQRLQELETMRASGGLSEHEYAAKRQQIIANL
ncbi:MAG TPA: SHOCT domain-containing protein [Mycobacterium sp.]|nr:SHOCT domain-containing protein [Mycobacterium sp.]